MALRGSGSGHSNCSRFVSGTPEPYSKATLCPNRSVSAPLSTFQNRFCKARQARTVGRGEALKAAYFGGSVVFGVVGLPPASALGAASSVLAPLGLH